MPQWILIAAMAATAACGAGGEMDKDRQVRAAENAPARDGNVAIAQELDAARRAATVEAYELFLARHPGHPLTDAAKAELTALKAERR